MVSQNLTGTHDFPSGKYCMQSSPFFSPIEKVAGELKSPEVVQVCPSHSREYCFLVLRKADDLTGPDRT